MRPAAAKAWFWIVISVGLGGCPGAGSQPPKTPDAVSPTPETVAGTWINESLGLTLTFDQAGNFSWAQGTTIEEGNYSLAGDTLYLSVSQGKTTPYKVLSLTSGQLSIQDPRGAVAYLVRALGGTAPPPGAESLPETPPELPKSAYSLGSVVGSWTGPYGIDLEIKENGSFLWKQPDYEMEGVAGIQGDSLNLEVQGNPTLYKILALTDDKIVIVDPEQHEIALARKQGGAGAAPAPVPSPPEEPPKVQGNPTDEKALFTVSAPSGWKVTRPSSCTFPCSEPYVLKDPAGRSVTLVMDTFITQAGSGAFNKLVPQLDGLMGRFSKNREKTVDPIDKMNGVEVFSRRFTGKTTDDKEVMVSRIIGVHYEDYLILGAVVTSAPSKLYKSLKTVMEAVIGSFDFSLSGNPDLAASTVGTWFGQDKAASSMLSLKSKHLFLFYTDGKFIHALASDQFVPSEENIKSLMMSPGSEHGTYKIVREAIMLHYDGPRAEGKETVEAYALAYDGNYLFMDSIFLKKVIVN
jgi:hypothetical protein